MTRLNKQGIPQLDVPSKPNPRHVAVVHTPIRCTHFWRYSNDPIGERYESSYMDGLQYLRSIYGERCMHCGSTREA